MLARYLLTKGDNDEVNLFDIYGTSHPKDLRKSLLEMSLTSELSRTDKGLYHVVINPRPGEDKRMTREDWMRAVEIMEEETRFKGQKRIMVMHQKKDRFHMHVAWERYCHETQKILSNRHSRIAQDRARKRMERELYQQHTPDVNAERPDLRKLLAEIWQHHASGKDLVKALTKEGYTVCRSADRRPFVIVNSAGRSFNLVREAKVKTKEVRERFKGMVLPNDKETIQAIREQQRSKSKETARERKIRELKEQLNKEKSKEKDRGR